MHRFWETLRDWARVAKLDVLALYLAARDPRVPWGVKALALAIAAYALSPIDLIPDFIPVIGFLDELVLLPAALWLAVRLIDPAIMAEHRARAVQIVERPTSLWGAVLVGTIWVAAAVLLFWALWPAAVG
jgi:uncharacterized membrane protein YkvA (DUF1232 family)